MPCRNDFAQLCGLRQIRDHPLGQLAGRLRPFAALIAKPPQSFVEVDIVATKTLLRQKHREKRGLLCKSPSMRCDYHCRQARWQRHFTHLASHIGQAAAGIQRAKPDKKSLCLDKCRSGRLIQKGKCCRILNTPMSKVENKARQIARKNLRRRKGGKCRHLTGMP